MSELEELKRQKREIEAKIRQFKNQAEYYGCVKLDIEHYPTDKPDRHYVAVKYKPLDSPTARWMSIYSANDRQSVLDAIPGIIEDLHGLLGRVNDADGT